MSSFDEQEFSNNDFKTKETEMGSLFPVIPVQKSDFMSIREPF